MTKFLRYATVLIVSAALTAGIFAIGLAVSSDDQAFGLWEVITIPALFAGLVAAIRRWTHCSSPVAIALTLPAVSTEIAMMPLEWRDNRDPSVILVLIGAGWIVGKLNPSREINR